LVHEAYLPAADAKSLPSLPRGQKRLGEHRHQASAKLAGSRQRAGLSRRGLAAHRGHSGRRSRASRRRRPRPGTRRLRSTASC